MTCKTKACILFQDYSEWYHFNVKQAANPFNLCDTDLMPSMPDDCSRCKRAYRDLFRRDTLCACKEVKEREGDIPEIGTPTKDIPKRSFLKGAR